MDLNRSIRLAGMAAAAFTALSAVGVASAAAAPAPQWKVNKAFLGAGKTQLFKGTSNQITRIVVPGAGVTLEGPTADFFFSGKIVGVGNKEEDGLQQEVTLGGSKFTVKGAAGCTVNSAGLKAGEIAFTLYLKGILVWRAPTSEAAATLIEPEKGTQLSDIQFAGTCPIKVGDYTLSGKLIAVFSPIATETATGALFEFTEPGTTSWYNNNAPREVQSISLPTFSGPGGSWSANLQGTFSTVLISGESFGIFGR
ncbi:MAG TPA: hypothetical protein VGI73_00945 [Solirubrobacterales bacterium]|jgi:hypothetical protein